MDCVVVHEHKWTPKNFPFLFKRVGQVYMDLPLRDDMNVGRSARPHATPPAHGNVAAGFGSLVLGLKAVWASLTRSPTVIASHLRKDEDEICALLQQLEDALKSLASMQEGQAEEPNLRDEGEQGACHDDVSVTERLLFQEGGGQFFPVILALSIAPIPSVRCQLAALSTLRVAAAVAGLAGTRARVTLAATLTHHNALRGFSLAWREATDGPTNHAIAETLFGLVMTNTNVAHLLLTNAELLLAAAERLRLDRVQPLISYHVCAIFHTLAQLQPAAESAATLLGHHVHNRLLDLVRATSSEEHATVRGVALHCLSFLFAHAGSALGEDIDGRELAALFCETLRSPWSEVIDGASRLVAAIVRHSEAIAAHFLSPFLFEHEGHVFLITAVGSAYPRVAASAANCLRTLAMYVPPSVGFGAQLLSSSMSLRTFFTVLIEGAPNDTMGEDAMGARIRSVEVGLLLGTLLCQSSKLRHYFSVQLERYYPTRSSRQPLAHALRCALSDVHVSLLQNWKQVDATGAALNVLTTGILPPSPSQVLELQQKREVEGRRVSPANEQEPGKALSAPFAIQIMNAAVAQCLRVKSSEAHVSVVPLLPLKQDGEFGDPLPPSSAAYPTEGFDKAIRMVFNLAKHHHTASQDGAEKRASSSSPQSKIEKEKNVWQPKQKVQQGRTWSVAELEKEDLFVFALSPALDNFEDSLKQTIEAVRSYYGHLHRLVETCPSSKPRRRCLLLDLYTNVAPRLAQYLETINNAVRKGGRDTVCFLLQEHSASFLDNSNVRTIAEALRSVTKQ